MHDWTPGACDGVPILGVPDAATVISPFQGLPSAGAERTRTMRAFEAEEMSAILARAAG